MAGIVKQTTRRLVIGNKTKEVQVPTSTLDTSMYLSDLNAVGAVNSPSRIASELNVLPAVVKNNASLALIADTYKEGAIYAMNGDSKSFDELGFSRGSQATYEDANGNIQLAPANVPRLNYKGGVLQGWLLEPTSSNLIKYSGMGDYNKFSSFNEIDRVKYTNDVINGRLCLRYNSVNDIAEVLRVNVEGLILDKTYTYSFSFYANRDLQLHIHPYNGGQSDYPNKFIDYKANSWQRMTLTFVSGPTGFDTLHIYCSSGTKSLNDTYFADFQLEEGSFATSYIPTKASSVVRLADKIFTKRPTLLFNKNSIYLKTAEYPSTWIGDGVAGLPLPNYNPLPSSYFKQLANGHFEIAYEAPIHIKQLAIISRAMTQEEVV